MSAKDILTKEYLEEEHYNKGLSLSQIARNTGYGVTTLCTHMSRHGLKTQKRQYNQHGRKYIYDDNFFETIDTEEKAYWLGFIMADGYTMHSKKQKRLRIALGKKDESHLVEFIKSINSNQTINYDNRNPYVDINSTKMCDDLSKYGVVPNKSNKEIVPGISEHLMHHFIRGLFDGDGSWLSNSYENCETMIFTLLSSRDALSDIRWIMQAHGISFPKSSLFERKGIWCLRCNKREDVLKIIDYMYKGATIYLARKRQQAMEFVAYKSKRLNKQDADEIRRLHHTGEYSHAKLGEMFNTSRSNIGNIVNNKTFV